MAAAAAEGGRGGSAPRLAVAPQGRDAVLRLTGSWTIAFGPPPDTEVRAHLDFATAGARVGIDAAGIDDWDSVLPGFLLRVHQLAMARGLELDTSGLPDGALRLLRLATAVPARNERASPLKPPLLDRLGTAFQSWLADAGDAVTFLGETSIAFWRLLTGRAILRAQDLWLGVQQSGVNALPIIGLISFLVGMIQAFVGGSQLALFGAEVFVANLVAIAMLREMGPLMASLIMTGRTGSAYAAELGTMQVNEEIDALRGMGISPIEFLVLPRLLALALMMPLLAIYANLFGVLGGAVVGVGVFGISPVTYYEQSLQFVRLQDLLVGIGKAAVFGVLVGLAGCYRGIRSGRDAASVGASTTSAVVSGIVIVIIADFLINVIAHVLHI
ncbi:MAG: MlaE family lipid ABC transporter permease subunit [Geminicoccaceae bacterium]